MSGRWLRRAERGLLILGLVVLLVVLVALLLHFAIMGPSHHESGCATCLTVLVAGLVLALAAIASFEPALLATSASVGFNTAVPTFTSGRHPPIRSVLLRM